jgi:hypothetical protein
MRRQPKDKRNPLRLLRGLLSEKGPKEPVTQRELSLIIGVSPTYIKAIEAGQRNFSSEVHLKVVQRTGAMWNYGSKRWLHGMGNPEGNPDKSYSYALFCEFQKNHSTRPVDHREREYNVLGSKLKRIFRYVDDSRWWDLYFKTSKFIEDCYWEFDIEGREYLLAKERLLSLSKRTNNPKG